MSTDCPYTRRIVDGQLDVLAGDLAAIHIEGVRGAGTTTTAIQRVASVWSLDEPGPAQVVTADPDLALAGATPVLLDGVHRAPGLWDAIKRGVDESRVGGQFLITGRWTPGEHSGAGRINTIRMRPMTLPEREAGEPTVSLAALLTGEAQITGAAEFGLRDYACEVIYGGFPGAQRLHSAVDRFAFRGAYIEQILADVAEVLSSKTTRPEVILALLRALAAASGTTAVLEPSDLVGVRAPSAASLTRHIDALSRLHILDEVPAWQPMDVKLPLRVGDSRLHLADPALAAHLTGLGVNELLSGQRAPGQPDGHASFLSATFESLAALTVRVFAQASGAEVRHLQTASGKRDIPLIVESGTYEREAVAFKTHLGPVDDAVVSDLFWLGKKLGPRLVDAVVLTTTPQAYRRKDGIAVVPLGLLGA